MFLHIAQYESLVVAASDQHGLIRTHDAAEAGIASSTLRRFLADGRIERLAHGLYRVVAVPTDRLTTYMEASLWANGVGVIAHASALEMLDLADVAPRRIHLTVPESYNPRKASGQHYRVHRINLPASEVTSHEGVPVVTAFAAIRQSRQDGEDPEQLRLAIRTASSRGLLNRSETAQLRAEVDQ